MSPFGATKSQVNDQLIGPPLGFDSCTSPSMFQVRSAAEVEVTATKLAELIGDSMRTGFVDDPDVVVRPITDGPRAPTGESGQKVMPVGCRPRLSLSSSSEHTVVVSSYFTPRLLTV